MMNCEYCGKDVDNLKEHKDQFHQEMSGYEEEQATEAVTVSSHINWDFKSYNDKVIAFENIGFTQGDALKMADLAWNNLSTEVKKAIEVEEEEKEEHRKSIQDAFNDEGEQPDTEIGELDDVDYNIIGESQTQRSKYECEWCNSGFRSNESLMIHYNDTHAKANEFSIDVPNQCPFGCGEIDPSISMEEHLAYDHKIVLPEGGTYDEGDAFMDEEVGYFGESLKKNKKSLAREFDENKIKRDGDGKFATKDGGDNGSLDDENPYGGKIHTEDELNKMLEDTKSGDPEQDAALDRLKFDAPETPYDTLKDKVDTGQEPSTPAEQALSRAMQSEDVDWDSLSDDAKDFMSENADALVTIGELEGEDVFVEEVDEGGNSARGEGKYLTLTNGATYNIYDSYEDMEAEARQRVRDDLENEPEIFNKEFIERYSEISETDKRLFANDMADSAVEDRDVEELKSMADDWGVEYEEEEEPDPDDYDNEEDYENAYDEWESRDTEDLENQLKEDISYKISQEYQETIERDGFRSWIVDDQGLVSDEEFMEHYGDYMNLDIDSAVDDAIAEDGVEHFISGYDGESHETPNGKFLVKHND